MRPITEGDQVIVMIRQHLGFRMSGDMDTRQWRTIHYRNQRVASLPNASEFRATVVAMPQATGDLLYLDVGDRTIGLNPSSSEFVGLRLVDKTKKEER